jgi:hypothetical protein
VYRVVQHPPAEQEELIVLWLWSDQAGVFSHDTALELHGLSDILPSRIHLTLPVSWKDRQLKIPEGLAVHYREVPDRRRRWVGSVPVTDPPTSINDYALAAGQTGLIEQAIRQGLQRGLFRVQEVHPAVHVLAITEIGTRIDSAAVRDLGSSFIVRALSGRFPQEVPPDWAARAEELAKAHGARLYSASLYPSTDTVQLQLAWPLDEAPDASRFERTIVPDAKRRMGWS